MLDAGFTFAALCGNKYNGKLTRIGTTHRLEETENSVVAVPLRKWRHKSKNGSYGCPRYSMSQEPTHEIPQGATHLEFTNSRVSIVAPLNTIDDFKTMRGNVRFGRLRYNEEFIPMGGPSPVEAEREAVVIKPQPNAPVLKAAKVAKTAVPVATKQLKGEKPAPKGESVCGYIDSLIVEKSRSVTEIVNLVLAKFPGRDAKATQATVRCRPAHVRRSGRTPYPFIK